jgi:hypothetical protein
MHAMPPNWASRASPPTRTCQTVNLNMSVCWQIRAFIFQNHHESIEQKIRDHSPEPPTNSDFSGQCRGGNRLRRWWQQQPGTFTRSSSRACANSRIAIASSTCTCTCACACTCSHRVARPQPVARTITAVHNPVPLHESHCHAKPNGFTNWLLGGLQPASRDAEKLWQAPHQPGRL